MSQLPQPCRTPCESWGISWRSGAELEWNQHVNRSTCNTCLRESEVSATQDAICCSELVNRSCVTDHRQPWRSPIRVQILVSIGFFLHENDVTARPVQRHFTLFPRTLLRGNTLTSTALVEIGYTLFHQFWDKNSNVKSISKYDFKLMNLSTMCCI